jgi:X-Pro dipeptidyl-peptidase
MNRLVKLIPVITLIIYFNFPILAIEGIKEIAESKTVLNIVDGEAQIVDGFKDPDRWIRHDLWVETEFDSDGNGKLDRIYVDVTRPYQTDSEGVKLPVIYKTSPYFAGTGGLEREYFWNVKTELNVTPPKRTNCPPFKSKGVRPLISKALIKDWVPRGFVVVHSSSDLTIGM